jgi:outer membrane receptor for ferrienterochelin and colicins
MYKLYTIYIGLIAWGVILSGGIAVAQTQSGIVLALEENGERQALPGATVQWSDGATGTSTDAKGYFQVPFPKDSLLIIGYLGYYRDTFALQASTQLDTFILYPTTLSLSDVEISGSRRSNYISSLKTIKTEVIGEKELTKAACCDLAGCFETEATVEAQTTNLLTNARELRILGLSGVYNQLLFNGLPMFQGLSFTYGISGYPGTLLKNIFIAKGANSVLQGFDGWAGQINVIPKSPEEVENLLINAYLNNFGEKHLNVNLRIPMGKKQQWNSLLTLHQVLPSREVDRDGDAFTDLPMLKRSMIYHSFQYSSEKIKMETGYRGLIENRLGGQLGFNPSVDKGSNQIYGQSVDIQQGEVFNKTQFAIKKGHKLQLQTFYQGHLQESYFGTLLYLANQERLYINFQYEWDWGNQNNVKAGMSYRSQKMREEISFPGGNLGRTYEGTLLTPQRIPGVFVENHYQSQDEKISLITGIRWDHHQTFGAFITPRAILKYQIDPSNTIRLSAGAGWREIQVFSEHLNLLASSREVVIAEDLKAEQGWNWGGNYLNNFILKGWEGSFTVDYYQTLFTNQIFPDFVRSPGIAYIDNFFGQSISNALQIEANLIHPNGWEAKIAYNYLDIFRLENEIKDELPFNSRHKFMSALSYRNKNLPWYLDLNLHLYGSQRLPNSDSNPEEYQRPQRSQSFTLLNFQATRILKKWEIYGGVENILDFRQLQPILAWQEPFSPYFDTSFVWGPTRGREFYIGFRYTLPQ